MAHEVHKAVNGHFCPGFFGVVEEQLLPRFLAPAILGVAEPTGQSGLDRGGQHNGCLVVVLSQAVQQVGGKAKVALHKVLRILRAVHTGQIEDEVGFGAIPVQLFRGGLHVVLVDLVNMDIGPGAVFAVPDIFQVGAQGGSHHAPCAGDQDVHLVLPPHHLIDHIYITLNNANHLHRYGLVHIVGAGLAQDALLLHLDGHVRSVQQLPGSDTSQDEVPGFQGLGALGGGADAHGGDGMADGQVEAALLRQGAGIGDDGQSIHLQLVVVIEAQGLVDPDSGVQPEAALLQPVTASGVAGIEDGHIVLLCQGIDGGEEAQEVLFGVDVFLPVGRQENIPILFQAQSLQHITLTDLVQIHVQHLRHGRAGHVGPLLGQARVCQILPGELTVAQVHVGDHVHDPAVGLLRQALVLAAIAGLHMKQGDVQPLGADGGEAGVGVTQHQIALRLQFGQKLIAAAQDVAAGHPQVLPHHRHQNVGAKLAEGVFQFEILPEHGTQVPVPVLVVVDHAAVKIFPAAFDDGGQPDDLRPGAAADHDFGAAVVFPFEVVFHFLFLRQPLPDVAQGGNGLLGFFQVQAAGVVGVELRQGVPLVVALFEVLIVVEPAVVGGDPVEVPHVDGLGALLVGEEGLVHLLAVADADDLDFLLLAAEELADGFRLGPDGAGGGLLDEQVAVLAVLEGEEHQVHGLLQGHDEPGHVGLSDGDGVAGFDLVDPQGDDGAPGAHDVAVAGAADFGLAGHPGFGNSHLLLNGLGHAHGVDGVGGLVGGQADDGLHPGLDGGGEDVVRADDVGPHGLHGEELAGGHLLQSGGVEDIVHPGHGPPDGLQVPDVANVKLDLIRYLRHSGLVLVAHVVLLLLIPGEDADLANVRGQKAV